MFEELFSPLYAPLPDAGQYLRRIGMTQAVPDKQTLDRIIFAHQTTVPFENLDVYDSERDISLSIPVLFDKIVTQRRGGYCFEQNAAFMALLMAIGYDCYAIGLRVVWNNKVHMPVTHRATVVTLDGARYFCDVGFGGPSPRGALCLDTDAPQTFGPDTFRLTHEKYGSVINRITDNGLERILMFDGTPVEPVDFIAYNYYQSKSPDSVFRKERMLNLTKENGSVSMSGNILKIRDGGTLIEKTLTTEAEIKAAMVEHFGIVVDFALKV